MENPNSRHTPTLCPTDRCTACSACYNACPKEAIAMREDRYGELHPNIDPARCIGCGLCEKACPELRDDQPRRGKPDIYACWLLDADDRQRSTSGGASYAIARAIICKGGHVWGAAYDDSLALRYTEANTLDELRPIQKSKYVQSTVGNAFRCIKAELDRGELVLFTGTGCHVKGLRTYLRREYDNLFTADLVCHGVPGQGVFRKYIAWLEARYHDKAINYLPRHKRADGQEVGYYAMVTFRDRGEVKVEQRENSYFIGFQHNLFLRPACHQCQANGEERYADFTLGDFWGLGKVEPFSQNMQRPYGISMLALNTDKARRLFDEIKDALHYERRTYREASFSNTQYYRPAKPSPRREEFREEWDRMPWDTLADKYMTLSLKEKALFVIKKATPPVCYLMLNHWRNG